MAWELDSDRPIYMQLAERIRQRIITGTYPPGGRMPAVRELAAEAAVNPNTMQRALAELENDGLLVTQRTSGRTVTDREDIIGEARERTAHDISGEFASKMKALGMTGAEILKYTEDALRE